MFIGAHEAEYMFVTTLLKIEQHLLAQGRCPYKLVSVSSGVVLFLRLRCVLVTFFFGCFFLLSWAFFLVVTFFLATAFFVTPDFGFVLLVTAGFRTPSMGS